MSKKALFETFLTIIILLGITTAIFLYTSGYRLEKKTTSTTVNIKETGMISTKSIPEGAKVYLDNNLISATNTTIPGIEPGLHDLRIEKSGFVPWQKKVEVFPELVTDITAILISESPRLEPLTNTGAAYPSISPSLSKLAYFSKDVTKPGIWVIPLTQTGLSIFKSNPYIVIQDTVKNIYSKGSYIEWSPDEKQILVTQKTNLYNIIDLQSGTSQTTESADSTRTKWLADLTSKRTDFLTRFDIPDNIRALAISNKSMWSPDEKKFLYTVQTNNTTEYRVYNLEKPLPVGEKVDNLVFITNTRGPQPRVSWYYDSYHLLLASIDPVDKNKGLVDIIRIDGSNKTEIYNNTLLSDYAFSAPSGDKIIILTSFKSSGQSDLYTIGIR